MDSKLLDILVCPACKGPLLHDKAAQELICKPCALAYAIRDGIPFLIEDDARPLTPVES
jgi:uncharacterized protein YbaR (Trm112 family)